MKVWNVIWKILVAVAAVAGVVFVLVTYGDRIVAWFKKTFGGLFCCDCCCDCECDECDCECDCDDCECECDCECEAEAPAEADAVAEQADFEG
jgi:hypothetical protein